MPRLIAVLSLLASLIGLFWLAAPTLEPILAEWTDDGTYSHGFLLLAVCAWLVWQDGKRAGWPRAEPWLPGMLMLMALAPVYAVTLMAALDLAQRLVLVAMIPALVSGLWGRTWGRLTLPALVILTMAVPLWGLTLPLFQGLTTRVVSTWLEWQGVAALIQGNFIRIPAGTFEIAQGCSGLRYLLVASAITLLWGHLYLSSPARKLLYWLVGIGLALLTNWLRVYALILVGHYTDMQHPLMADHNNFGWYLFAAALLPMFWIGRRLMTDDADQASTVSPAPPACRSPALIWRQGLALSATLIIFLAAHGLTQLPSAHAPLAFHPPLANGPLQLTRVDQDAWRPDYQGLDQSWHLQYRHDSDDRTFRLFLGHYQYQRNGAELSQADNRLGHDSWVQQGQAMDCAGKATCMQLNGADGQLQVLRWHLINGQVAGSRLEAKWLQLLGQMGGRPDASVVTLSTDCLEDCDAALAWLRTNSAAVMTELADQLQVPDSHFLR